MVPRGGAPVKVTDNGRAIAIESYGRDLFYVDNVNGPGSVWRLPHGGGPAVQVVEGVVLGNFDVAEEVWLRLVERLGPAAGQLAVSQRGEVESLNRSGATSRR
jgi:hypothetical protein